VTSLCGEKVEEEQGIIGKIRSAFHS